MGIKHALQNLKNSGGSCDNMLLNICLFLFKKIQRLGCHHSHAAINLHTARVHRVQGG